MVEQGSGPSKQPGASVTAAAMVGSASLVDALDHALNRGVVLIGQTTLSLAGVDLVHLGLNLLVSSVETLDAAAGPAMAPSTERAGSAGPPDSQPARVAPSRRYDGALDAVGLPTDRGVGGALAPLPPAASGRYSNSESQVARAPSANGAPAVSPLAGLPERLPVDAADRPERGLAQLVLALVEALRQLLERQAIRRMEGGRLTDDEVERMGLALLQLERKMQDLRAVFGLSADDLNVDLGPLGQLL